MAAPQILFVPDAGAEVGGGHVMRSLTLAQALAERGARPAFLVSPAAAAILEVFAGREIDRIAVADAEPQTLARAAAAEMTGFDAVVFDHYGLDAKAHQQIAGERPVLVIDDLGDRALGGAVIVDPTLDRDASAYAGRVDKDATLLLGPRFALVRPQFAALRETALQRRGAEAPVQRVLVSMGLTDVGGVTARIVNRILPRLGDATLDVLVGAGAPSHAAMSALSGRDPRVHVLSDVTDMAALMAEADLAVGAGGGTSWERATLGLPSLVVMLAENQAADAQSMADHGAAEAVDLRAPEFEAAFDRAFTGLMRSADRRRRLAEKSGGLCDGEGTRRVAEAALAALSR
jgi:UDP-2,4-diacetamido-2,4,6-trideoxy-beta-L-altropyranose hydrolase